MLEIFFGIVCGLWIATLLLVVLTRRENDRKG